jgi:type III secretion protein J
MLVTLTAACQTRVQHGLEERDANRVVAALRQAGVEASKVREEGRGARFAVEVPRGQETQAIQVLLQQDLPRRRPPGLGEVFGKSSLVPTSTEQRARLLHALAGELATTLEASDGVLEARVHLVLPERDPLALRDQPAEAPRAAVFLRTEPGRPTLAVDDVKRLVAGAVSQLDPAQVSVVIRPAAAPRTTAAASRLAQVGPVSVSADSRRLLLGLLAGGLALVIALAGALAVLAVRLARRPAPSLATDDEPVELTDGRGRPR